ncbi:hypothetical protein [Amycolatopsis japonica]|uniref:hypothetical protein n=1 Tax=Amycolatopsis japonica TaxID=208439 RepID=UPI00382D93C9
MEQRRPQRGNLPFPVVGVKAQLRFSSQVTTKIFPCVRATFASCEMLIATVEYGRTSVKLAEIRAVMLTVGSLVQALGRPWSTRSAYQQRVTGLNGALRQTREW